MVARITVDKSMTLRSIEELRGQLLDTFASDAAIELDASATAEIDLSFIQLLEAARVYAERDGKSIRLSKPAHPALAALLERAGFLTAPTADDVDFWFHGALPQ